MQSEYLIQTLIEQTKAAIQKAESLKTESVANLTKRFAPDSWNILECLEHLNLYGAFYLPEMEHSIRNSKTIMETEFESSLLGNYFAKSMLPKEKLNRMKTFKSKNPLHRDLDKLVINTFIGQQLKLMELLHAAQKVSLNKVKVKTSLSSLLKLNLGDCFQFFINHNLRHLEQIKRIEFLLNAPTHRGIFII